MPVDDLYWNSIDFGSEETLHNLPSSNKQYVDSWDLENYAYIRQHLHSVDSSEPTSSSGEFMEANSTSFYYIPGNNNNNSHIATEKYDSVLTEQGNYAAIDDDIQIYDSRKTRISSSSNHVYSDVSKVFTGEITELDSEIDENVYEGDNKVNSFHYLYEAKDKWRQIPIPSKTSPRDRSLSFSYGDYGYDPYKQDIYNKLDERKKDTTLPSYDDVLSKRKPKNFGLSNYGHLKIDYSYSWNNLDKYICN